MYHPLTANRLVFHRGWFGDTQDQGGGFSFMGEPGMITAMIIKIMGMGLSKNMLRDLSIYDYLDNA